MKDNFEIAGATELSNDELMLIQGGNIFGDAWNWAKGAVKTVSHALSSNTGKKVISTVTGIAGVIGSIISLF